MTNLLAVLGILLLALVVILPLVQRFAKPVEPAAADSYQRILGFLMAAMAIALVIRFLLDN